MVSIESIIDGLRLSGFSASRYRVARLIGVSEQTVKRWAEGDSVPSAKNAYKLKVLRECLRRRGDPVAWQIVSELKRGRQIRDVESVLKLAGLEWLSP